eukprot:1150675-Pelagomonas_calceolata.AAC.1
MKSYFLLDDLSPIHLICTSRVKQITSFMPKLTHDGKVEGEAHGRAEVEGRFVVLVGQVLALSVCCLAFVLSPQILRNQKMKQ